MLRSQCNCSFQNNNDMIKPFIVLLLLSYGIEASGYEKKIFLGFQTHWVDPKYMKIGTTSRDQHNKTPK